MPADARANHIVKDRPADLTTDPDQGDVIVRVTHLKKHFPIKGGIFSTVRAHVRAVDDVSVDIHRGETLGVVGESGCGKTTFGRMLVNLLPATDGEIWFKGKEVRELARENQRILRRTMQIVFQDPASSLNPRMTIRNTVGEPLVINREAKGDALADRVRDLLDLVGLKPEHMNRFPHEFSGGQKQRIGIARALALNPEFIVLDEPTSALDVSVQAQVLNLLADLQRRLGLTYVFITHALNVVHHISDRVAVMYLGKIVELAPTSRLFDAPQHPYTQALLSAIPEPDPSADRIKQRVILPGDVPSPVNPPSGCRFHPRCPIAQDICKWDGDQFAERVRASGAHRDVLGDPDGGDWDADRGGVTLTHLGADRIPDVERAVDALLAPDAARHDRVFWRVYETPEGVRVDFEPPLAVVPGGDAATSRERHYAACFFAGEDITRARKPRAEAAREGPPEETYRETPAEANVPREGGPA